ncbi:crossover junction endodeoxyribonuclease RuvC [bacterium]|nr:crossover junction endodeoxyribonuclease RuvC [bacterium]
MRILGIDPGVATTGVGIVEKVGNKLKSVYHGAILTPADMILPGRLELLASQLNAIIREYRPDQAAVEELFFNKNVKTALVVGQARGAILLTIHSRGLPIFDYTPMQVKVGVSGYGGADKRQVQLMVKQLLNLDTLPKPDDVADALAIAICHSHSIRLKSLA